MENFYYTSPETIESYLSTVKDDYENMKVLAGGTDILPRLRKKVISPETLINIKKINSIKGIRQEIDGITIGSLTRIAEICNSNIAKQSVPLIHNASLSLASPLIRNLATIGGNICNASPAGDMIPPLMCYDAELKVASIGGDKNYKIEEFFVGPGSTKLSKGDLLTEIFIPLKDGKFTYSFIKYGYRKALEIAVINVATLIELDEAKKIKDIKIALGSVAPRVFRLREAEDLIKQAGTINNKLLENVADIATEKSSPMSDIRATAEYRSTLLRVLVKRSIIEALSKEGVVCDD